MNKDNTYIVVCAYNEEKAIASVINGLNEMGFRKIVVVNDGSSDETGNVVRNFPVVLIEHIINRGQGAAIATGLEYCSRLEDCKFIATFDADSQHRPEDLEKMAEMIFNSDSDIVLGSRFLDLKSESMPFGRKFILKCAALFIRFMYGLKFTDAHNGLRIMKKEVCRKIMPFTDGMLHASEMIYLIKKNRLKYLESPVKINYTEYSISKGQKSSGFAYLGFLTIYHKIILLLFEKD